MHAHFRACTASFRYPFLRPQYTAEVSLAHDADYVFGADVA